MKDKTNIRGKRLQVMMTEAEYQTACFMASKDKITVSDLLRNSFLYYVEKTGLENVNSEVEETIKLGKAKASLIAREIKETELIDKDS